MDTIKSWKFILPAVILLHVFVAQGQSTVLDEFETVQGWSINKSDGVELKLSLENGVNGKAIRIDYDFTKGTGYGGIQKRIPIKLSENFILSYDLKANSPGNNFEIKFIDGSGDNVWWVNNRNYQFPEQWENKRIRPRHISFAWGPTNDKGLKQIEFIEFTIASFLGGKGTVWLDNLRFETLPQSSDDYTISNITASSSTKETKAIYTTDGNPSTYWQSKNKQNEHIIFDFGRIVEFGGLAIQWLKDYMPGSFDIFISDNSSNWKNVYTVKGNLSNISYIPLPETETRYLKIQMHVTDKSAFGISELGILTIDNTLSLNKFFKLIASQSLQGDYPRYFSGQASYWTITGVNNDKKEALINEDGMVEVDKASFSIEPALEANDIVYNWSNVNSQQSLDFMIDEQKYPFTPNVALTAEGLRLDIGVTSYGEANANSKLYISYILSNTSEKRQEVKLHLLIRPFQVNPCYQFLNLEGGVSKLQTIEEVAKGNSIKADNKIISFTQPYNNFSAFTFDVGNPYDLIRGRKLPGANKVVDAQRLAQAVITYTFSIEPGQKEGIYLCVPYYENQNSFEQLTKEKAFEAFRAASDFWSGKINHIQFQLPQSARDIIDAWEANLYYILVNRDIHGIQPGSRSYERSWIRDGSLTSSALMKSGIIEEVKAFTDWYAGHQYENGKVPCVVDFRGPDPVPENDSHGQLIYLIKEYFNFTNDTTFLKSKNEYVLQAVSYIETLINERSTDYYKYGNDSIRAHYGLVPESISHEGYSEKPMHSYWDNFFIIKGLKDAAEIQKIIGDKEEYERISKLRDTFTINLYQSINMAMKVRGIDYIPGCVELGDFDATSTTVALTPCNELKNLPKPEVFNTFEKYYQFFLDRKNGKLDWVNYTPYENRLIGSFILLDQPERAHELITFFLDDQRPQGWHHWAEIVWNDYRKPNFIGDMPHTWVGSDFINSIRSMFVYENEYDASLVIASSLYQEWIDDPDGMAVTNLPTYFGSLNYEILKSGNAYHFDITGDLKLPSNGIKIKNFNSKKMPKAVWINGKESTEFSANEISVRVFPAELIIEY